MAPRVRKVKFGQARSIENGYVYRLEVPGRDDRFYKTHSECKKVMTNEVNRFLGKWKRMRCVGDVQECERVMRQIMLLDEDGGRVTGYLDVMHTVRYRAFVERLVDQE